MFFPTPTMWLYTCLCVRIQQVLVIPYFKELKNISLKSLLFIHFMIRTPGGKDVNKLPLDTEGIFSSSSQLIQPLIKQALYYAKQAAIKQANLLKIIRNKEL